jgi:hypothetical protein
MSNSEIRDWYLRKVAAIPDFDLEWQKQGLSLEERAKRAWQIRHDARLQARDMMENPVEVEALRARDRKLYGHPDGPNFEQLLAQGRAKGLSVDQTLQAILAGAQITNDDVNERVLGRSARRKRQ